MAEEFYPSADQKYNQTFRGFFGKFGTGAGSQVIYLQSTIKPNQLENISLISDLPDSETWSIRDLFQRDVDNQRVTGSILPYFQAEDKVKFFNPLTLTVLPFNPEEDKIQGQIPTIKEATETIEKRKYSVYELPDRYKFSHLGTGKEKLEHFGKLEWNSDQAKIIAIDGQHRLSALKKFYIDTNHKKSFLEWRIPVVIVALRAAPKSKPSHENVLDIVRSIFVYINTQAKPPNETRQILLSDESINSICTQELLEKSHKNDVASDGNTDDTILPLLFFDWRGEEKGGIRQHSETSLKDVVELRNWFSEYLLGEDFSNKQKERLGVNPTHSLQNNFVEKNLDPSLTNTLRETFRENFLPGISYLLSNFIPYKNYCETLRAIDRKWSVITVLSRHALHKLKFGVYKGRQEDIEDINKISGDILGEVEDAKADVPELIRNRIGMRGVIYAFAKLKKYRDQQLRATISWEDHARWYTKYLNIAYEKGWMVEEAGQHRHKGNLRFHISRDPQTHNIINFKFDSVKKGLGPYYVMLIATHARAGSGRNKIKDEVWKAIWADMTEELTVTLTGGYRKQARAKFVQDQEYPNPSKELTEAAGTEAVKLTKKHLSRMEESFDKVASG